MSELHDKALKALQEFIKTHKRFKRKELLEYVYKKAGTTRIAPARDVRDWIEDAREYGWIRMVKPYEYEVIDKDTPSEEVAGRWILNLYKRYKKAVESLGYDCNWEDFKQKIVRIVEEVDSDG